MARIHLDVSLHVYQTPSIHPPHRRQRRSGAKGGPATTAKDESKPEAPTPGRSLFVHMPQMPRQGNLSCEASQSRRHEVGCPYQGTRCFRLSGDERDILPVSSNTGLPRMTMTTRTLGCIPGPNYCQVEDVNIRSTFDYAKTVLAFGGAQQHIAFSTSYLGIRSVLVDALLTISLTLAFEEVLSCLG